MLLNFLWAVCFRVKSTPPFRHTSPLFPIHLSSCSTTVPYQPHHITVLTSTPTPVISLSIPLPPPLSFSLTLSLHFSRVLGSRSFSLSTLFCNFVYKWKGRELRLCTPGTRLQTFQSRDCQDTPAVPWKAGATVCAVSLCRFLVPDSAQRAFESRQTPRPCFCFCHSSKLFECRCRNVVSRCTGCRKLYPGTCCLVKIIFINYYSISTLNHNIKYKKRLFRLFFSKIRKIWIIFYLWHRLWYILLRVVFYISLILL